MRLHVLMVVIAVCLPLLAVAQTAPMDCTSGPIAKSFGGSKWLVSSCADERTVMLRAMNDSPAFPGGGRPCLDRRDKAASEAKVTAAKTLYFNNII